MLFTALITLLAAASPAYSAEQWEICLDKADFSFSVDGFVGSTLASKQGCRMKFSMSGGKGLKYEVDVCDPQIHVDYYPAIDSNSSSRYFAGTAGCPAPLFGANYDDNFQELQEYRESKKKIFEIWDQIRKEYGKDADTVNLSDAKSFSPSVSSGKIACGTFLLKEYLESCLSFEGKQATAAPAAPKGDLKGVHPQTILVPREKKVTVPPSEVK